MELTDLSPSRLIALSFAGYLLAASGIALLITPWFAHLAHRVGFLPCLLVPLSLIASGVALGYKAVTAIGDGVRLERWATSELQSPRRIFEDPRWRATDLAAIATALGLLIAERLTHDHDLSILSLPICYFTFWTSGIRRSLKEPRTSHLPPSRIPVARLQSQHWGH